jgi:hypothetical protein
VRRGTAITLILLFSLLVVVAIVQLSQDPPATPYPGPSVSGTPSPSSVDPSPST